MSFNPPNTTTGSIWIKYMLPRAETNVWDPYFRVEAYRKRGKGEVYRIIRIRDNKLICPLVKNKWAAEDSCLKMVPDEKRIVEAIIEKEILG